ncbi:hypothetical protein D3C80_1708720 [compost metagenome]
MEAKFFGNLVGGFQQALEICGSIAQPVFAGRNKTQGGDARAIRLKDWHGEAVGEILDFAVEGEETIAAGLAHLRDKIRRFHPPAIGQNEIFLRDQFENLLVAQVRDKQTTRSCPDD